MASACARLPRLACSSSRLLLASTSAARLTPGVASRRAIATTQLKKHVRKRYGTGVEGDAWEKQRQAQDLTEGLEEGDAEGELRTLSTTAIEEDALPPTDQEVKAPEGQTERATERRDPSTEPLAGEETQEDTTQTSEEQTKPSEPESATTSGAQAEQTQSGEPQKPTGPLEAVLHMAPPRQHPHMAPPPYVHHFDTYSLVKQLGDGGYSQAQAIEVMKGVRAILAQNLDVAQESLVSKSDVENETYLFRAACSELSTEIKNNRRLQDEQMRQQRTHLQHEVDILNQSLNQELLTLNDTVRGMFNDRKMAVREEQKSVESAVQQISYKISIMLSSDAKSEIEGVRWILIRRSVLGILFMAVLTLGTLRYATYVKQERKEEAKRRKKLEEEERREIVRRGEESPADAAVILAAN
ncbi:hypothetical protein CC79DRAFT_1316036 [Sarocladium strictum]